MDHLNLLVGTVRGVCEDKRRHGDDSCLESLQQVEGSRGHRGCKPRVMDSIGDEVGRRREGSGQRRRWSLVRRRVEIQEAESYENVVWDRVFAEFKKVFRG